MLPFRPSRMLERTMNRRSIGIGGCEMIDAIVKPDKRGVLGIIDSGLDFPFVPRRMFYVHQPVGIRGRHAHKQASQFILVLSGALDILLDNGQKSSSIHLSSPYEGVYMPPMIWSEQFNFTPQCIYVVLACSPYDETDYIRNRLEFDRISK